MKWFKKIIPGEFTANVFRLSGGIGIANLIPFIILPVLTRMYTPEDFGVFGVYWTISSIIAVFATGRYEMAILLPKSYRLARYVQHLSVFLTLMSALAAFVLLFAFFDSVARILELGDEASLFLLIPVTLASLALIQVFNYALNRQKQYAEISYGKILYALITALFQIGIGIWVQGPAGLILGAVFGPLAGWVLMSIILNRDYTVKPACRLMKKAAHIYSDFPKYNAPHALVNYATSQVPTLLYKVYFTSAVAGFYVLAIKLVMVPVMLVSSAVGQVYSREIAMKLNAGHEYYSLTIKMVKRMSVISIFPFVLLFVAAPEVVAWFMSEEYREVGVYVRYLSPAFYGIFVVAPLAFIPMMTGHQREAFLVELLFSLLALSAVITGIYAGSIYMALGLYTVVSVIKQIVLMIWFLSISKKGSVKRA